METATTSLQEAFFLHAHDFFDGNFIEGVHRHFDVAELDPRSVGFDADLDIEVDDALDGDESFHPTRCSN